MTESNISATTAAVVQAVTPNVLQGDNWFGRNKTKIVGLLGLTATFLLTDPTLADDLPPSTFKWTVRVLSLLTVWVGFLNTPEKTK